MKVCYVVNQYPMVSHSFIRREILALEAHGIEVLRIALRGWNVPPVDPADAAEQQRTRFVLRGGGLALLLAVMRVAVTSPVGFLKALGQTLALHRRSDKPLWKHLVYLAEACIASRWIIDSGCAHIHAHFGTNSTDVALLASLLSDRSFSFTVHGPEEFDRPDCLGLGLKIAAASRVVAISSYGRSQLYRWTTLPQWQKIEVVHCGLDTLFTAPPAPVPASPDTLVCVGRLCEQKGQLLLLEALRLVRDRRFPCRIVLAGDGPMRAELQQRAAALGVADQVRITGWLDGAAVRQEILAARALVLPSFAEGLPVVIMEAMALGRPVISTYVAGIPELVIPGECGWLVPAGDVQQLADAIIACLQADAAKLVGMGAACRARALTRHDVAFEAGKLARMFHAVVAEVPRSVAS